MRCFWAKPASALSTITQAMATAGCRHPRSLQGVGGEGDVRGDEQDDCERGRWTGGLSAVGRAGGDGRALTPGPETAADGGTHPRIVSGFRTVFPEDAPRTAGTASDAWAKVFVTVRWGTTARRAAGFSPVALTVRGRK